MNSGIWTEFFAAVDKKLAVCDQAKRKLEKEEDALQKEFIRLTQGKVLELPKEILALFERLNIHVIYGMDWLKKNGYSLQKNEEIVRRQPFLPYALILSKQDMKVLSEHDREIYTSFPIPIILREQLEEIVAQKDSGLLVLQGVHFFLWFNEKLLDEEALRLLIMEKEMQIQEKNEQIAVRRKEYEEYFKKRERLKNQKLTKEVYDKNAAQLSEMEATAEEIRRTIYTLKSDVQKNEEQINKLAADIAKEQVLLEKMQRRDKEFALFCSEYEAYLECMEQLNRSQKEQERHEQNRKRIKDALETSQERLKSIERAHTELDRKALEYQNKRSIYEGYQNAAQIEDIPLPATAQEQEARFEAITSKMSMQVQDLEQQLQKTLASLNKLQKELDRMSKKYALSKQDWEGIIYDEKEQTHQEILLEDRRNKWKIKDRQWNDEDKETAVCQSGITTKKKRYAGKMWDRGTTCEGGNQDNRI